jgi:hypothetical protein
MRSEADDDGTRTISMSRTSYRQQPIRSHLSLVPPHRSAFPSIHTLLNMKELRPIGRIPNGKKATSFKFFSCIVRQNGFNRSTS